MAIHYRHPQFSVAAFGDGVMVWDMDLSCGTPPLTLHGQNFYTITCSVRTF